MALRWCNATNENEIFWRYKFNFQIYTPIYNFNINFNIVPNACSLFTAIKTQITIRLRVLARYNRQRIPYWYVLGGTEENMKSLSQNSRSLVRNPKPGTSDYKAVLLTRSRRAAGYISGWMNDLLYLVWYLINQIRTFFLFRNNTETYLSRSC
jgi:hypothetical protein